MLEPLIFSLMRHAQADPQRLAFVYRNQEMRYGEFVTRLMAAAQRLRALGIAPADRVVICGPNSPSIAIAYFAAHAVGAITVLVAPTTVEASARFIVEDSEAKLALMGHRRFQLPCPTYDLDEFANSTKADSEITMNCHLDDRADLLYTTGTTGRPKGVLLNHRNLAVIATNINTVIPTTSADLEVVPAPLSHVFALGRLRCMAQSGCAILLEEGLTFPLRVLKNLVDRRATGFFSVPAGIELLLKATGDKIAEAAPTLRYLEIGAAPMRLETKRRLMALLPTTRIYHNYGLTEASRTAFIEYHRDAAHLDSVGKPSPAVEIQIWDEHDQPLPDGELGELVIRGETTMQEYWKQPELTRQVYAKGWLHTGDVGYYKEGYLYFASRKGEIINVGGLKVAPIEAERALDRYPGIIESACKGMPDPKGITGEAVKAFVVTDGRAIDYAVLVQWLREYLEEWQIPKAFQQVAAIPKTASGKFQRHLLE